MGTRQSQVRSCFITFPLMREIRNARQDTVLAIAEREGLCASPTDAGLFQFTKVWVEDALLVELLTPQQIPGYLGAFGAGGVATLDARFRELERTVERKLKALRSPAAG